jgi:hypothetical protein
MTSEPDIYLTANTLVMEFGAEQALLMAAKRVDELRELGDKYGHQMWKGVLQAIQERPTTERQ